MKGLEFPGKLTRLVQLMMKNSACSVKSLCMIWNNEWSETVMRWHVCHLMLCLKKLYRASGIQTRDHHL
jgi:hypothetical protein